MGTDQAGKSANVFGLTERQVDVLAFITEYIRDHGSSPTIREIATGIGVKSHEIARQLVIGLRERGRVTWSPHKSRSIVVIPKSVPVQSRKVQQKPNNIEEMRDNYRPAADAGSAEVVISESFRAYMLPHEVQAKLDRYCAAMNVNATDVVAEAVALHLDRRRARHRRASRRW